MAQIVVGQFTFDSETGKVAGPSEYMADRYDSVIAEISAGRSAVFNYGSREQSDPIRLALVCLQTDYAGWVGMRSFGR